MEKKIKIINKVKINLYVSTQNCNWIFFLRDYKNINKINIIITKYKF